MMDTPIIDFVEGYRREGMSRLHMPGHKGRGPLGCENRDITEILGADSLYEAAGIIARSERNAAELFGAGRTVFSTEGSSQCIRAMLYLAVKLRPAGSAPVVLAARNVHKSFIYAAALVGFDVAWLYPETGGSLCSCPITAQGLEGALAAMERPPAAVYVTSPDYLGGMADIAALARTAHRYGTVLLVDNAHGAYLRFLTPPRHPMDLGADLCCDSAHKTLRALTGGAYLHIGKNAPAGFGENAKGAMALFGSTSPSYLILASLDGCNAALAGEEPSRIREAAAALEGVKGRLAARGWILAGEEPLKLTIDAAASGWSGHELAGLLRVGGVEPEYADGDFVVLMVSGATEREDLQRAEDALCVAGPGPARGAAPPVPAGGARAMDIRAAFFAPHETVPVEESVGRVCAAPTVACPPAIPIAVAGEVITAGTAELLRRYGVETVEVVR